MDHTLHFGVANLTPFQVWNPNSSPNYDSKRRIETNYELQHAQEVTPKMATFLKRTS
jgi:hypothetical protein